MHFHSPTERPPYNTFGEGSFELTEAYGCDFSIVNNKHELLGIQRKRFPQDLAASIRDGRLAQQVSLMVNAHKAIFVFEGTPAWSNEGALIEGGGSRSWGGKADVGDNSWLTRSVVQKVTLALACQGHQVFWVDNSKEFLSLLEVLSEWWNEDSHDLLALKRPEVVVDGKANATALRRARMAAAFRVVPGVGPKAAGRLAETVSLKLEDEEFDLTNIMGVGPKMAKDIANQFG